MNSESLSFVERLYAGYLRDPKSVDESWQRFFADLSDGAGRNGQWRPGPAFERRSLFHHGSDGKGLPAGVSRQADALLQERVDMLVRNYRVRGHMAARLDPLDRPGPNPVELDPAHYGFTEADYDRLCSTERVGGFSARKLGNLLESLRRTYCRYIGVQFMHIDDLPVREWLQEAMA